MPIDDAAGSSPAATESAATEPPVTEPAAAEPVATDLSFAEEQLWLADQAGPMALPFFDCAPSLSLVVRLEGALHRQALAASLDDIVRRHDVLRSRFVAGHGRPVKLCEPSMRVAPASIDLRGIPEGDRPDGVTHVLADHVKRPFDLARGPLLRATLAALADDEHVLAITAHHIVFDRWSKRVLAWELKQLYEAYATGRTPGLEPLAAQYRDYVQWQRHRLSGATGHALIEYWAARMRGLADLELPGDGARERASSTSGTWWFTVPAEDAARLGVMSRRRRVSLATTMLTIFKLLLYRVSGVDDIAVGVPISDRRSPEFEHLIGLFMNVVVARTAITDRMTFLDLLQQVRGTLVDACRNQDLPYGYLLQVLGAQRPLYRVIFNFMPTTPASEMELPGLHVEPLAIAAERQSLADLSLHVHDDSGALACRLLYKSDLFSSAWIRHVAGQFQRLVTAVLDEPGTCIGAYDLSASPECAGAP